MTETSTRGALRAVVFGLCLALGAGPALAEEEEASRLTEKNVAGGTVVIDEVTYRVTADTKLRDAEGDTVSLASFPTPEKGGSVPVEFEKGNGGALESLRAVAEDE